MKKTQLIIFDRPNNALVTPGTTYNSSVLKSMGLSASQLSPAYSYQQLNKPNNVPSQADPYIYQRASAGKELDLFDDVSIPITFTILDVREPEKRKTSWSKTITIPGTKNNNRIFSHIYEISSDNWIKIGNTSVYQGFNPNLRTEVIVLNDGIQVMKGNMQLKKATRDRDGNIIYEVAINGDLTSLFYDVGDSKLADLDWTEFDHFWTRDNVISSWSGINQKSGVTYSSADYVWRGNIRSINKDSSTGRLTFTTAANHNLKEGDFARITLDDNIDSRFRAAAGEWRVMSASASRFSVNYFYPIALPPTGMSYGFNIGTVTEVRHKGEGYVYPMISWGDEYDENTFSVTNFVPGYYVKQIWDKIMKETNSSYESKFLDSQFFKRLFLIQKKSNYDINPGEISSRKFWVGLTGSYTTLASGRQSQQFYYLQNTNINTTATASILPQVAANRVAFKKETGWSGTASFFDNGATQSGQIGNWDESTNSWKVTDSGEYTLNVNLKLNGKCVMNGYEGDFSFIGTASFTPNVSGIKYFPGKNYTQVSSSWKPAGCGIRIVAEIKMNRNGFISKIGETVTDHFYMNTTSNWTPTNTNWLNFGTYQPANWRDFQISVPSSNTYFAKGDEVWVELKYYLQAMSSGELLSGPAGYWSSISFFEFDDTDTEVAPDRRNIRGDWSITLDSASYIFNTPSAKSSENSIVEGKSFLPKDLSCKDFLLGIIKSFNLHIEPDKQIERKYYIEPRDEFYKTGTLTSDFVDWTDKIDNDSVEIIPLGELIAKYYTFENKSESDYWNKKFSEDRGRQYQYYKKEIVNDFLKNEVKITVPFGSSVMINNPADSDVVMPAIIQRDTNGSAKPVANSSPRMLFWGGLRPYTRSRGGSQVTLASSYSSYATGWELLSSVVSTTASIVSTQSFPFQYYPYAGTVDSPSDPYFDINWFNMEEGDFVYWDFARWTNNNLYNAYWSNFINEISDPASKVVRAKLWLKPSDIFKLDFRKIYVIDGHWLRLQKVLDYDPLSDGLTQCEFLKLISPSKFVKRSIVTDSYSQVGQLFPIDPILNPGPIKPNVIQYAPVKKKPNFGFNNTTLSSDVSNNLSIQTTGSSNFVASSAKNVKVTGDENSIGEGSKNIHISSGNGNFISGGLNNVNIIGTNKVFIQESDVTYINGVRYKNGIAISKSNVIDACEDVAVIRQSINTVSNLIDAGEDIVIQGGSTTYENLIDSGKDAILPDLPELGIGTLNNPNPRTNTSGGFDNISPTASITERVRLAAFLRS